jgi:hypothetical protein
MTANSTTFKKGTSGNPSGKAKTQWLTDALRLELAQNPGRARKIADKIIGMAEEGDLQAANIVFDRLEGRPMQQLQIETTTRSADPAEIDRRIEELASRLRIASIPPLIDAEVLEVAGDDDTKH